MTDTAVIPDSERGEVAEGRGRVSLTARLDPELHEQLLELSDREDRSLNTMLNRAVEALLEARRRAPVNEMVGPNGEATDLVELVGDQVRVDGVPVPYLTVHEYDPETSESATSTGAYWFTLDHRFGKPAASRDEAWTWAWFIAQCMAVAGGYTCHGPNAARRNPHGAPSEPEYVPHGCLNLRWNDDGTVACIHDDHTDCDLPNHTTISLYARSAELRHPWMDEIIAAQREVALATPDIAQKLRQAAAEAEANWQDPMWRAGLAAVLRAVVIPISEPLE